MQHRIRPKGVADGGVDAGVDAGVGPGHEPLHLQRVLDEFCVAIEGATSWGRQYFFGLSALPVSISTYLG